MHPSLTVQPVVLLSLPRSGSTLVQRVLGAHPDAATVSEPWFLLPLTYSLRESGARAEYWHPLAAMATNDLADALPEGRDQYLRELGELATRIYSLLADGASVFVDKTPRYHLIWRELPRILPAAKFVFLWRNPLAVTASLLRTFRDGRFEPDLFDVDLDDGVNNLTQMWEQLRTTDSAMAVRYEDLLSDVSEWRRIFDFVGLEFDEGLLSEFSEVKLEGRYGDPTGVQAYSQLSAEPEAKWLADMSGPVRRMWARSYLERIGDHRLELMGYERRELEAAVASSKRRPMTAPVDLTHLLLARVAHAKHQRTVARPDSPQPI